MTREWEKGKNMRNMLLAVTLVLFLAGCQQARIITFSDDLCIALEKPGKIVVNCPTEAGRHIQEISK